MPSIFRKPPSLRIRLSHSPDIWFPADGQVKSGAASFGAAVDGDAGLGRFTLTTSADFSSDTEATITVTHVSQDHLPPTATYLIRTL